MRSLAKARVIRRMATAEDAVERVASKLADVRAKATEAAGRVTKLEAEKANAEARLARLVAQYDGIVAAEEGEGDGSPDLG